MSGGRDAFQYAVLQAVPSIERGERFNAGVVCFCRTLEFLGARTCLDDVLRSELQRVGADVDAVAKRLAAVERIAAGDPDAGPIARLSPSERYHWLVAPASTVLQPSAGHVGLTGDPAATLDALFEQLVARA